MKVVDFGLAKLLTSDATKLTVTGSVVGTPHYLSPEQALGQATDPRADLFACGVVLYQLLTGQRPYDAKDVGELLQKIARAETQRADVIAPEVNGKLAAAVHRSLARNPSDRFATAQAMRAAILSAVRLASTAAPARRKKRSALPLFGVLAVAGLLGAIVAVSVVVGLSLFAGGDDAGAADSFDEPAPIIPILDQAPSAPAPPMAPVAGSAPSSARPAPSPPPPLGVADCDAGSQLACNCRPEIMRGTMCESAHDAFRQWRVLLTEGAHARPAVEQACRTWYEDVRRVCAL